MWDAPKLRNAQLCVAALLEAGSPVSRIDVSNAQHSAMQSIDWPSGTLWGAWTKGCLPRAARGRSWQEFVNGLEAAATRHGVDLSSVARNVPNDEPSTWHSELYEELLEVWQPQEASRGESDAQLREQAEPERIARRVAASYRCLLGVDAEPGDEEFFPETKDYRLYNVLPRSR